jgi:hypothetical protein
MGNLWGEDGGAGADRAERRGCVLVICGFVLAVIAMLLTFASVVASWIRDARLLGP